MKNVLLAAALLTVFTFPCFAQKVTCSLKVEEAPEVRGFKLGQSYDEIQKGLPPESKPLTYEHPSTVRHLYIASALRVARILNKAEPWTKRFEGLEGVGLIFLDDKLAGMTFAYDTSTTWNDPLEFTAAIARSLNLPRAGWRGRSPSLLDCAGFTVYTAVEERTPRLTIKLLNLDGELVTRKYEALRKKREAFKP